MALGFPIWVVLMALGVPIDVLPRASSVGSDSPGAVEACHSEEMQKKTTTER